MNLICDLSDQTFLPNPINVDRSNYNLRKAARGVMTNHKGEVALMWIEKYKMYKLPGGGINENEDIHEGLKRELLEETGCRALIGDEIGITIEFRDEWKMVQISHCFRANLLEDNGQVNLDKYEAEEGFEVRWVPIDQAISLMEKPVSDEYDPKFMQYRDLRILKVALSQTNS